MQGTVQEWQVFCKEIKGKICDFMWLLPRTDVFAYVAGRFWLARFERGWA
jgi:hypothetical protein